MKKSGDTYDANSKDERDGGKVSRKQRDDDGNEKREEKVDAKTSKDVKEVAGRHLGKADSYTNSYFVDPSLLVAVPRSLHRRGDWANGKDAHGYDSWVAHEFSVLINSGLAATGKLKIVYRADSEFIVESKSLKLYLHSYNFVKSGTSHSNALRIAAASVAVDLSNILNTEVLVKHFTETDMMYSPLVPKRFDAIDLADNPLTLISSSSASKNPHKQSFLKAVPSVSNQRIRTSTLMTNCPVTSQPDWASVFVAISGNLAIHELGFLKYIASLRHENHFHEETCDLIFGDIIKALEQGDCELPESPLLESLTVATLYTRRGGIEINSVRFLGSDLVSAGVISDVRKQTRPFYRQ